MFLIKFQSSQIEWLRVRVSLDDEVIKAGQLPRSALEWPVIEVIG